MFVQYGYCLWLMTFIGICAVLGAIGLLVPRLAGLAATGLCAIMIAALTPVVVLALLVVLSYARFKESRA
jgi:hypothetical protein